IHRSHHIIADPACSHEGAQVDGGFRPFKMFEVFVKRRPIHGHAIFLRDFIGLFFHAVVDGGDRTAFASNFGGNSLRDFARRAIVDQYIEFRLALHVDKSWRNDETLCVQAFSSRRFAQVADGGYAITGDGNVTFNPWGAGAVNQVRSGNDELIVRTLRRSKGGKKQEDQANETNATMESAAHGAPQSS